jgi:O-antigen/teichoic acid export membrane protein
MAIPIPKNDKAAINVLALSIIILSVFVLTLVVLLYFFGNSFLNFFNSHTIVEYWFLIPLGVFLLGLYKIFYTWASRYKDFNSISKTSIGQSLFGNIFKSLTGLMGFGGIGLILGNIIGQSAGTTTLGKTLLQKKELVKSIQTKRLIWCLKRFKNFPIYNLPTHIISILGEKAPIIFFTGFYGTHVVGLYGLAFTIVRLPMTLIGKAVGDVFFAEAASVGKKNPKRLKSLSNKLISRLALIGFAPLGLLLLLGPQLFRLVFGEGWYEAGIYARIISISLFFILIFAPVSRVYEVFEKQKLRFFIDILRIILILVAFGISFLLNLSSYTAVLLYSIVVSFIHLLIYIVGQKIINDQIRSLQSK